MNTQARMFDIERRKLKGWFMDSKFPGKCRECGCIIHVGDRIGWAPEEKLVYCVECAPGILETENTASR